MCLQERILVFTKYTLKYVKTKGHHACNVLLNGSEKERDRETCRYKEKGGKRIIRRDDKANVLNVTISVTGYWDFFTIASFCEMVPVLKLFKG